MGGWWEPRVRLCRPLCSKRPSRRTENKGPTQGLVAAPPTHALLAPGTWCPGHSSTTAPWLSAPRWSCPGPGLAALMLTLCYLIARCAGGSRLALQQGKVMAGVRTNTMGEVVAEGQGVWKEREF